MEQQTNQQQPQTTQNNAPNTTQDDYPGKTLGIVGLVLAFLVSPVGLVLSIISKVQSKKAGYSNTLAIVGIVVGAVITVFWTIVIGGLIWMSAALIQKCNELGPGVHHVDGITYKCGVEATNEEPIYRPGIY